MALQGLPVQAFDRESDNGHEVAHPPPPPRRPPKGDAGNGRPPDGSAPRSGQAESGDASGRQSGKPGNPGTANTVSEPVNLFTGNFSYEYQDLHVPGRGLPLRIVRTYNSDDRVAGAFGVGWASPFSCALYETRGVARRFVAVRLPDGERLEFQEERPSVFKPTKLIRDRLTPMAAGWDLVRAWKTVYRFDSAGKLAQVLDLDGNATRLSDSAGATIVTSNDLAGRLTSMVQGAGAPVVTEYDGAGILARIADGDGIARSIARDGEGRPIDETDALGNVTHSDYDAAGNLTLLRSQSGRATRFEFDAVGRLSSLALPWGGTESYTRDPDGRLLARSNSLGEVTTHTYDDAGRLLTRRQDSGNVIAFTRDGANHATRVQDGAADVAVGYDTAGNRTSESISATGAQTPTPVSIGYDAAGQKSSIVFPDGAVETLRYNTAGRLQGIGLPGIAHDVTFSYDGGGRPVLLDLGGGLHTALAYDTAGRTTSIRNLAGTTETESLLYGYTPGGRVASLSENGKATTYSYDRAGRVVGAAHPAAESAFNPPETFTYDADGNVTSNDARRDAGGRLTEDGQYSYTYDAAGRRTERRSKSIQDAVRYRYDSDDRLTEVDFVDANQSITRRVRYAYDGFDRRVSKSVDGVVTRFVYDRFDRIADYDASGTLLARYVFGTQADTPIAMIRGGQAFFYVRDHVNSVRRVLSAAGSVVSSYVYTTYGVPARRDESVPNPFLFNAREFDDETGLYYYRARYYDPASGTFLTPDPLVQANLYQYALGDPVNYSDPSGRFIPLLILGGIAGAAALASAKAYFYDKKTGTEAAASGLNAGITATGVAIGGALATLAGGGLLAVGTIGAIYGALGSAFGKVAENAVNGKKDVADGVGESFFVKLLAAPVEALAKAGSGIFGKVTGEVLEKLGLKDVKPITDFIEKKVEGQLTEAGEKAVEKSYKYLEDTSNPRAHAPDNQRGKPGAGGSIPQQPGPVAGPRPDSPPPPPTRVDPQPSTYNTPSGRHYLHYGPQPLD
ncbi:MAG: RHS repeat protein [Candidatus Wallbacteria bacterium]|nr:RHS repeat protein [Candidatus Wallbacteria bacterium]